MFALADLQTSVASREQILAALGEDPRLWARFVDQRGIALPYPAPVPLPRP